jgi:hypothetical protein
MGHLAGDGECVNQSMRWAVHRGSHRPHTYGPRAQQMQVTKQFRRGNAGECRRGDKKECGDWHRLRAYCNRVRSQSAQRNGASLTAWRSAPRTLSLHVAFLGVIGARNIAIRSRLATVIRSRWLRHMRVAARREPPLEHSSPADYPILLVEPNPRLGVDLALLRSR